MGWNSQEKDKRMRREVKCGGPRRVCVCIILGAYGPSSTAERRWPWPRPHPSSFRRFWVKWAKGQGPTEVAGGFNGGPEPPSSPREDQRSRRVTVKRRALSLSQTRRIRSILAASLDGAGEQRHHVPVRSCRLGRGSDNTPRHCSSTGRGITMRPSASCGKSLM